MPAIAETRLTDRHLREIHARLVGQLNDEGLRAWYAADVDALVREVLIQRRLMVEAVRICQENPALDIETSDLLEAVRAIRERWSELKRGVWARQEMKRLRETHEGALASLKQVQDHLTAELARSDALRSEIDTLSVRLAEQTNRANTAEQTAADVQRESQARAAAAAERLARVQELLTQATTALRD